MAILTCFLPHFPSTLQGRAKTSKASLLASRANQLPDLSALISRFLPNDLFSTTPEAKARRIRIYPPITVFWAFLFQVLNHDTPCVEVVGKVRAWLISKPHSKQRPALSTAAYCEARCALSINLLWAAFNVLRGHLERRAESTWTWCGHRVKVIDGTSCPMPDTDANQARWPQPSGQRVQERCPKLEHYKAR
jgi:hypothetical protein